MKKKALGIFSLAFVAVLFSVGQSQAQVVEKIKDAAEKTKDVTVDVSKKTASGVKQFGNKPLRSPKYRRSNCREGKYYTAKTWDGTKWVSKQVWINSKKAAEGTKDFIVGDEQPNRSQIDHAITKKAIS